MDKQPKIPTLKDTQKPSLKIKGLGVGLTLFDRLRQFKKKDLAFILAGLGTLFMAPLVEHFMMSPEGGDGQLQQGWGGGRGSGSGIFGGGGSPYESGNNSIASGGAIGSAGDIITPLNVRDPSSLVMGPGGAQQPPAGSAAAATPPPGGRSDSDLKDALAGAASRAASAAIKKAPLPIPKIALGGSGLRGLGVAGGGSSAAAGLGPIRSDLNAQPGTGGGGLNLVRSSPGFRGAAGPRGSSNPTGLDGTKKAGERAGDAFSRTGSALNALNEAAKEQIPTGGSGFGGGGQGGAGANDKLPGGSGPGGSKSVGESLVFIAAKERMMKNLELEFERKKLGDRTLLWYNLRNDALKTISGELAKKFAGALTDQWDSLMSGPTPLVIQCGDNAPKVPMAVAQRNSCSEKEGRRNQCYAQCNPTGCLYFETYPNNPVNCPVKPSGGAGGATNTKSGVSEAGQLAYGGDLAKSSPVIGAGLDGGCQGLANLLTTQKVTATPGVTGVAANVDPKETPYYMEMQSRGARLVNGRLLLNGEGDPKACANQLTAGDTVVALHTKALKALGAEIKRWDGLVGKAKEGEAELQASRAEVKIVADLVTKAREQTDAAKRLVDGSGVFTSYSANKTTASDDATKKLTDAKAELTKVQGIMATAQDHLEVVLRKSQDTVGVDAPTKNGGTLADVTGQNQAFADMKQAIADKKGDFAKNDPDWSAAMVAEPKKLAPGGSADPEAVKKTAVGPTDSAEAAIKAVCDEVGCTAPAVGSALIPVTAANTPKYAEVSELLQHATNSVATMRQTQSHAISGIKDDLVKKLGPVKD